MLLLQERYRTTVRLTLTVLQQSTAAYVLQTVVYACLAIRSAVT